MIKLFKRAKSALANAKYNSRRQSTREHWHGFERRTPETILSQRQQEILDRLTFGEKHTATFGDAANLYLDLNRDDRYLEPLIRRWGMQRIAVITQLEIARAGREICSQLPGGRSNAAAVHSPNSRVELRCPRRPLPEACNKAAEGRARESFAI